MWRVNGASLSAAVFDGLSPDLRREPKAKGTPSFCDERGLQWRGAAAGIIPRPCATSRSWRADRDRWRGTVIRRFTPPNRVWHRWRSARQRAQHQLGRARSRVCATFHLWELNAGRALSGHSPRRANVRLATETSSTAYASNGESNMGFFDPAVLARPPPGPWA